MFKILLETRDIINIKLIIIIKYIIYLNLWITINPETITAPIIIDEKIYAITAANLEVLLSKKISHSLYVLTFLYMYISFFEYLKMILKH
jgi:hypothetical protein